MTIPCDYPDCPEPAHFFYTVESVYCDRHLEELKATHERIDQLLGEAKPAPKADLNSLARCLKRFGW